MSSLGRALLAALSLAVLATAGCGPSAIGSPPPRAVLDTSIGPGDRFDVRVYGEEDLSSNYQVAQDGTIDFPYLGRVPVADLEATQVADLIRDRLVEGEVLVRPHVSVVLTEVLSRQFTVSGAVRQAGNHPVTPGLTVNQAVNTAGGTTDLADRNAAIVTRIVDGRSRRYSVPLDSITLGEAEDFPVQPGDIIYVPERPF